MLEFVAKSVPVEDATIEIKSTSKMSCEKFMNYLPSTKNMFF